MRIHLHNQKTRKGSFTRLRVFENILDGINEGIFINYVVSKAIGNENNEEANEISFSKLSLKLAKFPASECGLWP